MGCPFDLKYSIKIKIENSLVSRLGDIFFCFQDHPTANLASWTFLPFHKNFLIWSHGFPISKKCSTLPKIRKYINHKSQPSQNMVFSLSLFNATSYYFRAIKYTLLGIRENTQGEKYSKLKTKKVGTFFLNFLIFFFSKITFY